MTEKVKVTIEMDAADLWSAVFGNGALSFSWWQDVQFERGDWETPGVALVTAQNPWEGTPTISNRINTAALGLALSESIQAGYVDACTGRPITHKTENWDACIADVVLQQAVFGEVVYG